MSGPAVPEGHLQIGVVAERLGLSVRSLRHWEEVGLVTPSARSAGGFRLYTEADVDRLLLIRRMKPLGFSLEQMKEFLTAVMDLREPPDADARARSAATLRRVRTLLHEARADLHRRLAWADEFEQILDGAAGPRPDIPGD